MQSVEARAKETTAFFGGQPVGATRWLTVYYLLKRLEELAQR